MEKQRQPSAIEMHPLQGIERGRLLLGVSTPDIEIPPVIKSFASQGEFKPKGEYHVTVVGKKTQERLLAEGMLDDVVELLDTPLPWNIVSLEDILLLRNIETDDGGNQVIEESIIQLVTVPELNVLYDAIREVAGLDIPTPPAHITLFTKNADRGIGLYSNAQLAEYMVAKLA